MGTLVLAMLLSLNVHAEEKTVDKDAIRRVIRKNSKAFRTCYSDELKKSPDLSGKIVLEWNIDGEGVVSSAKVLSSTLKSAPTEECMLNILKNLNFPKPPTGKTTSIKFPFLFDRVK